MEIVENRALRLRLKSPHQVTGVIPKSKILEEYEDGSADVLVHWGLEESQVLKNLGIGAPSPILRRYKWPGMHKPFKHQRVTAAFKTLNRRAFDLSEQGTGKSLSTIWAADYLLNIKAVERVLILCPVSVMRRAWLDDIFKGAMHRTVSIAHGTKAQRLAALNENSDFTIINYDGVGVIHRELIAAKFDLVIIDEANAVKTATTRRWKLINALIRPDTWLWMLTGTPASQSPTDAYGLLKMMHPSTAPRTFTAFRDMVMTKVTTFKWAPKHDALDTVYNLLQPAIRYTKEECLDLPSLMYVTRDVELSPQQKKLYAQLKDRMAVNTAGETITAVHAAALLNKLLQASSGSVFSDDGASVDLDITDRYRTMCEVIDSTDNKSIVFVPYTNTLQLLHEKLLADGYTVEIIYGAVSARKREFIIKQFQEQPDPRVLLLQPQSVAHGITLHAADTAIWWGPVMSYETYVQANARIHRAGQRNHCTIVRLTGSPAEAIRYRALNKLEEDNVSLLNEFAAIQAS
jgi:SNF2 family DNA or RNA helicase